MGSLESHISQVMYILLTVVFICLVMAVAVGLMKTSRTQTNSHALEMEQEMAELEDETFTQWDGITTSGSRVKQLIKQTQNKDCAILVQTLSFLGNQTDYRSGSGVSEGEVVTSNAGVETVFKGQMFERAKSQTLPVVQIDIKDGNVSNHQSGDSDDITTAAFPITSPLKGVFYNSCLVNYGSLLRNSVLSVSDTSFTGTLKVAEDGRSGELFTYDFDDLNGLYGQTIGYLNGKFYTKQEFATNSVGNVLRFDYTIDSDTSGTTLYIDDNARFDSYVLMNTAGKYMGVVFIESVK